MGKVISFPITPNRFVCRKVSVVLRPANRESSSGGMICEGAEHVLYFFTPVGENNFSMRKAKSYSSAPKISTLQ
jgi:hypothetical protein